MANDGDESVVTVKTDADFRRDIEEAKKLTGIRNQSDLIRHAVRQLVRAGGRA